MCHTLPVIYLFCIRLSLVLPLNLKLIVYLIFSSLIGLTIGAVVSLIANLFVNGIKFFEVLRLELFFTFSSVKYAEIILPFAWLSVGFFLVFFIKKMIGSAPWQGPADAIYCAHRHTTPSPSQRL